MKKATKFIIVSALFCAAVILTVFSSRATEYARDALKVCTLSVIPSLFPYMVISQMIISSKAAYYLGKALPISRLVSLPECASAPIILGAVCGFPVGAKTAVDMYKCNALTKTEAEVLISFANNTGPSFIVSVIGASFFKSAPFGWQLYFFQLVSSCISSFIVNRLLLPYKSPRKKTKPEKIKYPGFFSAVKDSTTSVLTVCGFIVFFSVVSGFAVPFITKISEDGANIFSAILEFTGGARTAALIGGSRGRFLCGLSVGFSGISVFCQTAAFTSPAGLSLKRCVATKAVQGILTGLFSIIPICKTAPVGAFPSFYDEASVLFMSPAPTALASLFLYIFLIKSVVTEYKM